MLKIKINFKKKIDYKSFDMDYKEKYYKLMGKYFQTLKRFNDTLDIILKEQNKILAK